MKLKKLITFLIISIVFLLGLSGCTTFDNFKSAFIENPTDQKTTVRIGVYEPMSGADKSGASAELEGIEMAYELYPTVNGKVVELVYADNNSNIDAAATAIKTLIDKKPTVILGSYSSVYSLAAGEYINKAKIPTIAVTNDNPLVTKNYEYYYRVCYVDANQGDLLARYALDECKAKAVGVITPREDDAAMSMATAFTDRVRAETGNDDAVTAYEYYKPGADSFRKQLTAIEKTGVKYVILPGEMNDAAKIINEAADMGVDVQFLGSDKWGTADFTALLSEKVMPENMAFVQFFAASEKEATEKATVQKDLFLKEYQKKHGKGAEPDAATALGFDAYCLALNAIDIAPDDAKPEEVRAVIATPGYKFNGVSGQINFSKIGNPIKTAYISTWQNGKIETLATINQGK